MSFQRPIFEKSFEISAHELLKAANFKWPINRVVLPEERKRSLRNINCAVAMEIYAR